MDKIHCEYCQTPLSAWQPMANCKANDSCETYDYLLDVLAEHQHRPLTVNRFLASCRKGTTKALAKEFIEIQFDLGVVDRVQPGVYKIV